MMLVLHKLKIIIIIIIIIIKMPRYFSQLIKLFQIAATIPVSTASNERFFSVLKRVKTYLRTTMGDDTVSFNVY